jgi:hypothetical protein
MSRTTADAEPCARCRNPIALESGDGALVCSVCEPPPAVIRRKLLLVEAAGRREWADYAEAKAARTPKWKRTEIR